MAAIEQELHERTDNASLSCPAMPCSLVDTRFKNPKKAPLCLNFVSRARRLSGRRSCSTSRSVVMTFDMEGPFSASQKASWRTCTGKRPAISAGVHYLPVSLSCATQRVRPGRLTTKELADQLPCHGKIDCVRLDPAAVARSSLGPAAYSEYEQVFGPRLVARWPRHLVLDGLETLDLLLESGDLLIHPRCTRLKAAFQRGRMRDEG